MRVRGLKHSYKDRHLQVRKVAPRAGAWIETGEIMEFYEKLRVAPRAGAWIETLAVGTMSAAFMRRTPCGCVD